MISPSAKLALTTTLLSGALIIGALVLHEKNEALEAKLDRADACAAGLKGIQAIGLSDVCDPELVALWEAARAASICDLALKSNVLSSTCSVQVRQLHLGKASLSAELATLKADTTASLNRAEARFQTLQKQKVKADAALAMAPRTPDGFIVCDAQCLRDRFEGGPTAP